MFHNYRVSRCSILHKGLFEGLYKDQYEIYTVFAMKNAMLLFLTITIRTKKGSSPAVVSCNSVNGNDVC